MQTNFTSKFASTWELALKNSEYEVGVFALDYVRVELTVLFA